MNRRNFYQASADGLARVALGSSFRAIPSLWHALFGKRLFERTLLEATLLSSLSGCAYNSTPFSSYEPLIFKVQARDSNSRGQVYLFGSIHAGFSRFYPLPQKVEQAWSNCEALAVELDIGARHQSLREAFSTRVLLSTGETLDELLSQSEVATIRRLMGYDYQDWQKLRRLQPWALTLNLFSKNESTAGPQQGLGIDLYFLRRAQQSRRPIIELEEPQDQIEAFAGGTRAEQLEQLRDRRIQLVRYENTSLLIIDAWRRGDSEALAQIKREAFGDDHRLPQLHQRMNVLRDRKMAAALAAHISAGRQVFCVVGAFHLVGPDCIPSVLAQAHNMEVTTISG